MLSELAEMLGFGHQGADAFVDPDAKRSGRRALLILAAAALFSLVLGLIAFTDVI